MITLQQVNIIQRFMNLSNKGLSLKPLKYFQTKYHLKLREPISSIEPMNILCGGWSLQTFKQIVEKLSANQTAPLPFVYASQQALQPVIKSRECREKIFKAFDTRNMQRIDAFQLCCAIMLCCQGQYEDFLMCIVDVFGFNCAGQIHKNELFFFMDNFFRAFQKIVIVKDFDKPLDSNFRLQFKDISDIIKNIFGQQQVISRNQIAKSFQKQPALNQFLRYIQKRCCLSVESFHIDKIQTIEIQAQVRVWLKAKLDLIEKAFSS